MKKHLVLLLMALLPNMVSAQCPDGNHPHMIDLGLPSGTKWACCNVGATTPEGYGNYYAWGETQPKEKYYWDTYIHCDGSYNTCHDIGTDIAGTEYDAATANWGAPWRMPSLTQCQELINNCNSEWTTLNGANGRKFTGPNGGTIFLPAAGYYRVDELRRLGSTAYYWSSTFDESDAFGASTMYFGSSNVGWGPDYRGDGIPVRPVTASAAAEPEPYAVLSSNGKTVTFYYDGQKASRGGIDINNSSIEYGDSSPYGTATTAVFDASFADYRPVSTAYWFMYCNSLTTITGLENLKTDNVTNMRYMFLDCSNLKSLNVSGFNTSNVTDMMGMFVGCSGLTSLDVSGFDTSNVILMDAMFSNCSGLTSLDLSGFDTSNVTEMASMFMRCSSLTSLDLSCLNTSNVFSMAWMFDGCSGLTNLDLSGFDTSNVTNMEWMFEDCSSLTSLDLSSFDTSNVGNMMSMFDGCSSLITIYAEETKWSTESMTWHPTMFRNCISLVGGYGTVYDPNNINSYYACIDKPEQPGYLTQKGGGEPEPYAVLSSDGKTVTFYYDGQKTSRGGIDINNNYFEEGGSSPYGTATTAVIDASFADYRPVSTAHWFERCSLLTTITGIKNLNTSNVTDMRSMFSGCSGLTSLDVSGFNTSNVTNMGSLFMSCSGLTSLDVSGFNTSSVTNMSWIFASCFGLASLNVSNFNTSNVTDMTGMFMSCSGLTSLDVSGFNTSNVTSMGFMFGWCSGLTSLDVSGFNTSKVKIMSYMFNGCSSLTTIYADEEKWSTEGVKGAVTDGYWIFDGSTNLVGGNGTVYDANHTDVEYARIDKPGQPGYLTRKGGGEPEPYAVLSSDGQTVTFYYDDQKVSRGGIDINNSSTESSPYGTATTAVIDASFADYRPRSTAYWFQKCSSLTTITGIKNLKTDNVTDMWDMFYGCSGLTSLDVSGFNTSNVTDMGGIFRNCSSLTSLDVSGFNTSKVTNMTCMFYNCSGLTSLDLSGFDTSNVTDMKFMFYGCSGLTSLDVSGFNTSNVTKMNSMFHSCSGLTSLDVSGFNTSNVMTMNKMFYGCSGLTTIYVDEAKWSTANVSSGGDMFYNCTSLVGGNGTVYDANHTDVEYARIDKPERPGYFTAKGQEMEPIDNADFSNDINEDTDLDGNVVGDIYYNISSGDGSYDSEEGCIVVTTPTDDSVIDGQGIFDNDFQAGFTGIVFMVPEGKGTIKVEAQTTGAMALKVKIGDSDPVTMELEGRLKVSFPYNVTEPTYVYIYGGSASSAAPSMSRRGSASGELKLYGIEVTPDATGIRPNVNDNINDNGNYYSLDGRKLQGKPTQKGLYVVNGRKVVIK